MWKWIIIHIKKYAVNKQENYVMDASKKSSLTVYRKNLDFCNLILNEHCGSLNSPVKA